MSIDNWCVNINHLVDEFESNLNIKGNINHLYDRLCNIVFTEMDKYLEYTDSGNTLRKRLKLSKPYWNDELTRLWKSMKDKEKEVRKHRGCKRTKTKLYNEFKICQSKFNKTLRNTNAIISEIW